MEGRHTAGPWAAERGDMGGPWQITAGPFGTLATVNTHGDNPEADARLMSAAPDLLDACRPREEARFVVLHCHDGYTTNLSLEDFAAEDALLVHSWSGAPLEQEHGGPGADHQQAAARPGEVGLWSVAFGLRVHGQHAARGHQHHGRRRRQYREVRR